jgi:hypothetical protein
VIYIWDYEKCSTHCYLQHHIISSTPKQGEAVDTIILLIVGDHKEVVLQGCIHLFCLISGCWWLSHAVRCRITHGTCICPHTLEPYYRLLCATTVMGGCWGHLSLQRPNSDSPRVYVVMYRGTKSHIIQSPYRVPQITLNPNHSSSPDVAESGLVQSS